MNHEDSAALSWLWSVNQNVTAGKADIKRIPSTGGAQRYFDGGIEIAQGGLAVAVVVQQPAEDGSVFGMI